MLQHTVSRLVRAVAASAVVLLCSHASYAQSSIWTGAAAPDGNWLTPGNWLNNTPPAVGDTVFFDGNSTGGLATVNNGVGTTLNGIIVSGVPGTVGANPISIGGSSMILGSGGIDMSAATQPLTIALSPAQSLVLAGSQTWSLGAGTVGSNQTLAVNSPISGDAGSSLTFGVTNVSTASATSGTVRLLAPNTYLGDTVLGGPNTTYEIATDTPFGVGGTVNVNSFNTAPRLRIVSGTRTLANPMTWQSGFMVTADSTSNLTLNGPITFTGDVAGQINRSLNNTAPVTVTLNGTVTMGDPTITPTVNGRTFVVQSGNVDGSIVINGLLQDPTSATNTNVGTLTKNGAGPATINGVANTFSGPVNVQNGLLQVALLADQGTPSSIGTGAGTPTINLGNQATTGTLRYAGSANVSTNRPLSLNGTTGGGVIESGGAGSVTFTGNFAAGGAGAKALTLTGSNTLNNTIAGVIRDNSATRQTSLIKSGAGTWVLSGNNTYTGATTVSGGTLVVSGSIATSASVTITDGTLKLGSDQTLKSLDLQKPNPGNQGLDLNHHVLKITAPDLATAQAAFLTQIAPTGTDGVFDSTAGPNTGIGYDISSGTYLLAKTTIIGDATLDGSVDFNDLVKLAQNYNGTAPTYWLQGDFTYDGITDFNDLVKLAQNYNTSLPTAAIPGAPADFNADLARAFASVPEPTCLALLGVVAMMLEGRPRTRSKRT